MNTKLADTFTDKPSFRWKFLASAWLLVALAIVGHNIWTWGFSNPGIDTDIMSLLPHDKRDPVAESALDHMATAGEKRVLILVGAATATQAQAAGDAYANQLAKLPLKITYQVDGQQMGQWRDFFSQHRLQLLTTEQLAATKNQTPAQWQQQALQSLSSPTPAVGLSWRDDPFGLFNQWLLEQAGSQKVRVNEGRLWLSAEGQEWAVIMLSLNESPLSLSNQSIIMPGLQQAHAAALKVAPDAHIIEAGVLQFAAAASNQAQSEMSIIGTGSMLGVIILVFVTFRRFRPLLLAVTPIIIGTLAAISITLLVYGHIHAITLVFGASLVGVAEDYGIHYLCMGYEEKDRFTPFQRMRHLFGGLFLAMLTTVIAYAALAFTPFPGLRQMAFFAFSGLVAAWLTSLFWLPFLARPLPPLSGPGLWAANSRPFWANLLRGRIGKVFSVLILLILIIGLSRLSVKDDLRALQNAPATVLQQQLAASRLLDLPGPAQFYIVRGPSVESVLQREEALLLELQKLRTDKVISGYQAISTQVPSLAKQAVVQSQLQKLYQQTLPALAEQVGADKNWEQRLQQTGPFLTINAWLASPVSEASRHLWLGNIQGEFASVVALRGVQGQKALAPLSQVQLPGVRWVDKPAQISSLMAHYRNMMALVIAVSFVLVYLVLHSRYGRRAWRGLAPTLLATALTLAILGLCGIPVQLFTILGLFLVLGMGVDYGIFMLEHPDATDGPAWLAVSLGAITTILSFGLLAFSQTPALRSFGLATLIGIGASWLLAPAFQPRRSTQGQK